MNAMVQAISETTVTKLRQRAMISDVSFCGSCKCRVIDSICKWSRRWPSWLSGSEQQDIEVQIFHPESIVGRRWNADCFSSVVALGKTCLGARAMNVGDDRPINQR